MPAAGNFQKQPLIASLNEHAINKILAAIRQQGRSLPCSVVSVSGAIVTVAFQVNTKFPNGTTLTLPNVRIPVQTSRYVREPIKAGDLGFAVAADAYLGGMSGLGGGIADLSTRANLTALAFQPLGNAEWESADPNAVVIGQAASNGVRLQDATAAAVATVQPTGHTFTFAGGIIAMASDGITFSFGGHTISITTAGIILDGIVWLTHVHSDPQGGTTGPPE